MSIDQTADDRLIRNMHSRLDSMASTLMDKFNDKDDRSVTDNTARREYRENGLNEIHKNGSDRRGSGRSGLKLGIDISHKNSSRTAQHTPAREGNSHLEKPSIKREHVPDLNLFATGCEIRWPEKYNNTGVMARDDLSKLKDRLRKAFQDKPDSFSIKSAFPVKTEEITKFKSDVSRTYDLFHVSDQFQTNGSITDSEIRRLNSTVTEKSFGNKNQSRGLLNRTLGNYDQGSESMASEPDRDRSTGSRLDTINKLERKILKLKTENSKLVDSGSNQSAQITHKKTYLEKENFRGIKTPTSRHPRSIWRPPTTTPPSQPSSIRIPAYLQAHRSPATRHDPSTRPPSDSHRLNRSCSMSASVKSSQTVADTRHGHDGGVSKSKLDSLYASFVKSKDYWDSVWQSRISSKKTMACK